MEGKSIRFGWIVMLILGIFLIAASFYSFSGGWLERAWEQQAGQPWADFVAANPAATVDFVQGSMKMDGIAQLAIGVLILLVTIFAYRKGQKWSWYSLLAGGIIYWVGFLIFEIISGGPLPWALAGLVLLIIALAVPAKSILTQ